MEYAQLFANSIFGICLCSMLDGLSNVPSLLKNRQFPVFIIFCDHFCYHSNGKGKINTRYLHFGYFSNKPMRRNAEKHFLYFSLQGGPNSLLMHVPLCNHLEEEEKAGCIAIIV